MKLLSRNTILYVGMLYCFKTSTLYIFWRDGILSWCVTRKFNILVNKQKNLDIQISSKQTYRKAFFLSWNKNSLTVPSTSLNTHHIKWQIRQMLLLIMRTLLYVLHIFSYHILFLRKYRHVVIAVIKFCMRPTQNKIKSVEQRLVWTLNNTRK
jgi:hypothetical protein